MNKEQFERLKRENERLKRQIESLNSQLEPLQVAFSLPKLPNPRELSRPSRDVLKLYKQYLKRFQKYTQQEEELRERLLLRYGKLLGGSPRYMRQNKQFTPKIKFYTYEQLEAQGGIERLQKYFRNLRYSTNAREQRKRLRENYLKAIRDRFSLYSAMGYNKEITRFYNLIKRMSDIGFYEAVQAGIILEQEAFYEITRQNPASIVSFLEDLKKFNKERKNG